MGNEAINISIELDGVEPSERLQAALDELCDAASEMLADEVTGFGGVMGDEPAMIRPAWKVIRPGVQSLEFGIPDAYYDGAGNHVKGG